MEAIKTEIPTDEAKTLEIKLMVQETVKDTGEAQIIETENKTEEFKNTGTENKPEIHETYAKVAVHGEEKMKGIKDDKVDEVQDDNVEEVKNPKKEEIKDQKIEEINIRNMQEVNDENLLNTSPPLMDESIISVPESVDENVPAKDATFSPKPNETAKNATFSPEVNKSSSVKDSTFSPVADKSIQDSRPHIDIETEFNTTPIHRNITHRTSTPLAQKIMKRDTPKAGSSVMTAFSKVFSPKLTKNVVKALNDTVNGQFKLANPLERSILKSTRKRSLSVTDGESFVQKKVMFISPKVMDIGEIDERMMQSFRDEKEISMIKATTTASGRRKRSLSASEAPPSKKTPLNKKQMPDFKAIHEAQFKKMESIVEHKERKAERAKKLVTPSKSLPLASQGTNSQQNPPVNAASKIPKPSRMPLAIKPSTENSQVAPRPIKRSASAEPSTSQIKKPSFVPKLPRAMSHENVRAKAPPVKSKSQSNMSKIEERREKNISLYKTNVTRTGTADIRKKNENILKGVRLNRRFELMMQNRQANNDHGDD